MLSEWEAACFVQMGISCFDNCEKNLKRSGYMHNIARMWFASVWVQKLPCMLQLTSFCVILLIETPQLTLLSWRWDEGIQHISKTYLANTNKIAKYTNLVFTKTTLGLRKSTILPTTSHNRPHPTK